MKLLLASSIDESAVERLSREHDVVCVLGAAEDELKSKVADREAIVFRSGVNISAAVMRSAPNLQVLIRAGSGVDNIDLEYVSDNNLTLYRIPEPGAKAVAELSFGLMIGLARKVYQADSLLRRGKWAKSEMYGYLLTGKVLGVVGAGNIGSRVGMLGAAWGMTAIGCCKSFLPEGKAERLAGMGIRLTDFEEVVRTADFVSIHVPLAESTRGMFDGEVFSRMKKGAFLVNLARGGVVDEKALAHALTTEKSLRGAALDVHEREGEGNISALAGLPNVILTPHIGAQTYDTQKEIGERIVEILNSHPPSG